MALPRILPTSLLLGLLLGLPLAATAGDDPVFKAMSDELARATTQLRIGGTPPPYFVAYRTVDSRDSHFLATFGSLVRADPEPLGSRRAAIEVRVGSPQLDQSHFQASNTLLARLEGMLRTQAVALPLDDDVKELRRGLWLGTEAAYKAALEVLAKKKGVLESRNQTDGLGDLAPAEPVRILAGTPALELDAARAQALVKELSAVFRVLPEIQTASAQLDCEDHLIRYQNSEGSRFLTRRRLLKLVVSARTQDADGQILSDRRIHYGRSLDELPAPAALLEEARALGRELTTLRLAPPLETTYNGPVLFEGPAAARLVARHLANRLVANRPPLMESGQPASENAFQKRLGARVLAPFLSVRDEPGRADYQGQPLLGGHQVDDDGVPARGVQLIDHGKLLTLLTDRTPVAGFPENTGSRRGAGPAPSNLVVSAEGGLDSAALRARLLQSAREHGLDYGMIAREMQENGGHINLLVKLYADGREQPVRGVLMKSFGVAEFKTVLAAGKEPSLVHTAFLPSGASSGPLMGLVVPALLFDEISLEKPAGATPKRPVAERPDFP